MDNKIYLNLTNYINEIYFYLHTYIKAGKSNMYNQQL